MPLYEYHCEACGTFEALQKVSARPLKACPTCGKRVSRLISAPAVQFKGTGWYITYYARSGSNESKCSSDKGAAAKGDTSAGSSSPPPSDHKSGASSPPKSSAASDSKKASSASAS